MDESQIENPDERHYSEDADTSRRNIVLVEPNFEENAGLHKELIPDWLSILVQENRERVENVSDCFGMFIHPKAVQYFFTICLRLGLSVDIKYIAIGIFNEFMIAHISGLYGMVHKLANRSNEEKMKEWDKIECNISRQLSLRVLSCIQIASKIHSYHESLSSKKIRRCLQSLGMSYTEDAIRKSEVRVLHSLDFCTNIRQSPIAYVESVLNIMLIRKNDAKANPRSLWEYTLLLLDCAFLQLEEIYRRLLVLIHGLEARQITKDRITRLQADFMLLSAGVVMSSCVCVHGTDFADEAMPILSQICCITMDDVRDTSVAVMKTVMEFNNPEYSRSSQLATVDE